MSSTQTSVAVAALGLPEEKLAVLRERIVVVYHGIDCRWEGPCCSYGHDPEALKAEKHHSI